MVRITVVKARKCVGAALSFGTLRNLTGDHRWPECPFRSIVGGLDSRVVEEPPRSARRAGQIITRFVSEFGCRVQQDPA
jgi:hypothetical protein